MKHTNQNSALRRLTFAQGAVGCALVCAVGFTSGKLLRQYQANRLARAASAAALPKTFAPVAKSVPSLLASASETLPFVGVVKTPTPVVHKKHHYKKRIAKKAAAPKIMIAPASELDGEEPTWVQEGLTAEEVAPVEDADQAEDLYDAADDALRTALAQPEPIDDGAVPSSIPWQFDQTLIADRELAAERVFAEVAGTYKQNNFSEIRASLNTLTEAGDAVIAVPLEAVPESTLLAMDQADTQIAIAKVDAKSPEKVQDKAIVETTSEGQVAVDPSLAASDLHSVVASPVAAPQTKLELSPLLASAASVGTSSAASAEEEAPTLVSATGAALASAVSLVAKSMGEPTLVLPTHVARTLATQAATTHTNFLAPPVVTKPPLVPELVRPATTVETFPPTVSVASVQGAGKLPELFGPANNSDERMIDEKLFGEVLVDAKLSQWLIANKAHIELNLHPAGSRDPQDTVYIDYRYPAADFSADIREMRGAYRLLADIYTAKDKAPYAQVVYPKAISADTAKQKVLFRLSMLEVERNKLSSPKNNRAVILSSTIFEGASGDYRDPKALARGGVDVIGFPELGHILAEPDGTFHIPQVPGSSELLLHVQAEGFYPSFKVVPTFASDVYAPVYLLARDKVDVITRYFTHHLQTDGNGLLIGRVFDPKTRTPVADEQLALTYRRGAAVYFSALGSLPIVPSLSGVQDALATTVNGMFAFFNLKPSMRALTRSSGKAALLLNIHPQSADYIEFGRGGMRSLRGQILDRRTPIASRVRLVGDQNIQVDTDPQGNFTIPNLDLPPGVITLEVEARGYPLTWQTVAWNPRESETVHRLYLLDKDVVYDGAASAARVQVDSTQGVMVGHNSIFPKHSSCVYVSLFDTEGRSTASEQGPFSLVTTAGTGSPGLCLTRQQPWFSYFNLAAGEYVLKLSDQSGRTIRTHVVRIGGDRVSIAVD